MKLFLKLLLLVLVLLAGVYASSPLWLSRVVAAQLPPGWRLEAFSSSYPGLTAIRLKSIAVSGDLGPSVLKLSATDLLFEYETFRTEIGAASVDVFMLAGESRDEEPASAGDLSLPILDLDAEMPRLSVRRVDLALHMGGDMRNAGDTAAKAVRLDLEDLELTPVASGGFKLGGQLGFEDSLRFTGALAAEVGPGLIDAGIRFPSSAAAPWLTARFEQKTGQATTTTRIEAVVDADAANRDWLDSVLARSTRRTVTQIGGRFSLDANFAGQHRQHIEALALAGEKLSLLSDQAWLNVDAKLTAGREGDIVNVSLATPASLEYEGDAGWIDQLLGALLPGLRVPHDTRARVALQIVSGGSAAISTVDTPSARITGDVDLDLRSGPAHFVLRSKALQVDMADLRRPETAALEGKAAIEWAAGAPVAYDLEDMSLSAAGLDVQADVISRGGKLTSTGAGTFQQAASTSPAVTAAQMDLTWEGLDLEKLTGKLTVKTTGFGAEYDKQVWKGFEPDLSLTLLEKDGIRGSGKLVFATGPELPLEFTGNTQTSRWDIRLAPATVRLSKLRGLLSVAGIKLPDTIKMTDGDIDLQGDVRVGDEITAKLLVSGNGLAASLHENRVLGGAFTFDAGYDKTPRASGPLSIGTLELAGDIDLANFRAELELEDVDRFELKNLYAEVFGGRVEIDSLKYSGDGIADTTVRLEHIDLGKLLAYADVDGLQGSGTLDVTLPVGSDKTGMHVKKGTFVSIDNGRLAYTKQGVAGSNIGLKALENFHYKSLSGTLDYQSDGAYLMGVRLEGNNPDLYGGHPVVFNLNINGTLPALFESLFMTGDFEESILKEIKSRQ